MKKIFILGLPLLLMGCKNNMTDSSHIDSNHSTTGIESSESLEGLYHTKNVNGYITLSNDKEESGVYFYTDDTMYKGYHKLDDVKVYKDDELVGLSSLTDNMDAIAEFITGIGKEDGSLDLSIGDLYKVTIINKR